MLRSWKGLDAEMIIWVVGGWSFVVGRYGLWRFCEEPLPKSSLRLTEGVAALIAVVLANDQRRMTNDLLFAFQEGAFF
jgi:hypothetical protein